MANTAVNPAYAFPNNDSELENGYDSESDIFSDVDTMLRILDDARIVHRYIR